MHNAFRYNDFPAFMLVNDRLRFSVRGVFA